jgi:hypothetical protein
MDNSYIVLGLGSVKNARHTALILPFLWGCFTIPTEDLKNNVLIITGFLQGCKDYFVEQ